MRANVAAGVLVVALAFAPAARALSPDQAAVAQALFDEGKRLVEAGRYGEGCRKFEASQRIDPAIGTQFRLGDCYELTGRFASAWIQFLDVAAEARAKGQGAREDAARRRAAALEPRIPHLRVEVREPSVGLVVTRNGLAMTPEQYAVALPVDPGRYRIRARAPGHKPWSKRVDLDAEGAQASVTVPPLERGSETPEADGRQLRLRAAIGLGAVGLTSLAVGAGAGIYAAIKKSQADEHCPAKDACFQEGLDLRAAARPAATVSTVGISVGLGAAVGAAVLWLTARKEPAPVEVAPLVGQGTAGLGLIGVW